MQTKNRQRDVSLQLLCVEGYLKNYKTGGTS
jgi:hypothetical protein